MEGTLCFLGADRQIYAVMGANGNGALPVTVTGGSVANPAAGPTGAAVPVDADYQGLNIAGILRGQTGVNPSGSIFAGQVDLASIAGLTVKTAGIPGTLATGGTSAAAATDDGSNPNKIGGIFLNAVPNYTNGQRGNYQMSAAGAMPIGALNGTQFGTLAAAGSANAAGNNSLATGIVSVFNATLPTYASGQFGMTQMASDGSLRALAIVSPNAVKTGVSPNSGFMFSTASTVSVAPLAASPFLYNGTSQDAQVSINGAVSNGNAGTGTGAAEETGRPYVSIGTATTTAVKGSKGFLHVVVCGSPVALSTLTLYDNTVGSGAVVSVITVPAAYTGPPFSLPFDVAFGIALTAVTTGTATWTISAR